MKRLLLIILCLMGAGLNAIECAPSQGGESPSIYFPGNKCPAGWLIVDENGEVSVSLTDAPKVSGEGIPPQGDEDVD